MHIWQEFSAVRRGFFSLLLTALGVAISAYQGDPLWQVRACAPLNLDVLACLRAIRQVHLVAWAAQQRGVRPQAPAAADLPVAETAAATGGMVVSHTDFHLDKTLASQSGELTVLRALHMETSPT